MTNQSTMADLHLVSKLLTSAAAMGERAFEILNQRSDVEGPKR